MMHLHVCSFTFIYAGPRWWGLHTNKQFGPSHTRETSNRSGPKSFDSGQNWDDLAWDHSSFFSRGLFGGSESILFTDATKQMKSFQECRQTQKAGGTGSSHLRNVCSRRHSFWRDAKGAEPGPMSG